MVRWTMYLLLCSFMAGCVTVDESGNVPQSMNKIEASEARVTLGLGYLEKGQWQRARDNFELALRYAPRYYRAQNAMAYYYQRVDEPESAETMYRQALKDSPKNGDVRNNYGVFLCSQGRYDDAINEFERAIKQPYYYLTSASYENAALCSLEQGNQPQARGYFEKALSYDPYRARSMLNLSKLDIETQNFKEARVRLFKFNKRYGYKADSLWLLIQLEQLAGSDSQADKYAGILKAQYPNSQQYQKYLANEY
ncbi:type IV pilus biogenesis/stability protein PilW [Photobacterium sp. DNB23_23_1]|uniref:Type IV pilus biogenesis/stability protein PilW n=1 Tax=Photobacterium pectinilyticum TaxID=2906793 RepID=A0ABT1MXE0_9GAMM|nr:type IV pilus biogenesis/stability protein PilW [Photobacterium sp. ZSDE20]MCQ1057034.1 type IV pilus biogenesis/stability protein PilW [Photobacterium sp. ZSDE20]MDD1821169.1 type IV pilus biogenesis/stability protein PilW [Photobacterium sp. ZSDE20]